MSEGGNHLRRLPESRKPFNDLLQAHLVDARLASKELENPKDCPEQLFLGHMDCINPVRLELWYRGILSMLSKIMRKGCQKGVLLNETRIP